MVLLFRTTTTYLPTARDFLHKFSKEKKRHTHTHTRRVTEKFFFFGWVRTNNSARMQSMTILEKRFCNRNCEVLADETFAPSKWRKGTIGLRSSDLDCGWLWTWEVSSGNNSSRRWDHLGHRKNNNNNKGWRLWSKSSTWHREFAEENDDEKLGFITAHSLLNPSIFFFRFLQKLESLVKKKRSRVGGELTTTMWDMVMEGVQRAFQSPTSWESALIATSTIFVIAAPLLLVGLSVPGVLSAFVLGLLTFRAFGVQGTTIVFLYFLLVRKLPPRPRLLQDQKRVGRAAALVTSWQFTFCCNQYLQDLVRNSFVAKSLVDPSIIAVCCLLGVSPFYFREQEQPKWRSKRSKRKELLRREEDDEDLPVYGDQA